MNYLIKGETLQEIADVIREKTEKTNPILVSNMASEIASIKVDPGYRLEVISVTPGTEDVVKTPSENVTGIGRVTVRGDKDLVPENIRENVAIFGVIGTHGDGIDTSNATATADDIVEGATAYVNGVRLKGTHRCEGSAILGVGYATPTGTEYVLTPEDGVDGFEEVIVEGDPYLHPDNILDGATIYGVTGNIKFQSVDITPTNSTTIRYPDEGYSGFDVVTVQGVSDQLYSLTVTPGVDDQVFEPEEGYSGFDEVTVDGDSNLKPENIVEGVTIFGVKGTATGGTGEGIGTQGFFLTLPLLYEVIKEEED